MKLTMPFDMFSSGAGGRGWAPEFLRKTGELFAVRLAMTATGLLCTILVSRILGPEARGFYAVAVTVGAIGVQFGNLGIHSSSTYVVVRDRSLLPCLAGNVLVVGLGFGGIAALTALAVFLLWPTLAPVTGLLLVLALAWIPFGLTFQLEQNLLIAIREIRAHNVFDVTANGLALLLVLLLIALGRVTPESVMCVGVGTVMLGALLSFRRLSSHCAIPVRPSVRLFTANAGYGFRAYLSALFVYLMMRSQILVIQYVLGPEQAGYFSIAAAMADLMLLLPVVLGLVLFPRLSAMTDEAGKYALCVKAAVAAGLVMTVAAAVMALLAGPLVMMLFGEAYRPAVPVFVWLTPGIVAFSINAVYMNFFASIGMPAVTIYAPAVCLSVVLGLSLVIVPGSGIEGAAVVCSLAYVLMVAISLFYGWFRCRRRS